MPASHPARANRYSTIVALTVALTAPSNATSAADAAADNLHDLFVRLNRCLRPVPAPVGSQITVRFALKRDGSLLGRPKITFAVLPRGQAARQDFVAGVAGAFARCLPVKITDSLGGAVAGRPLTIRLVVEAPSINA